VEAILPFENKFYSAAAQVLVLVVPEVTFSGVRSIKIESIKLESNWESFSQKVKKVAT
jgi:hypothetical protein